MKPWGNHGETMGKPWGNHGDGPDGTEVPPGPSPRFCVPVVFSDRSGQTLCKQSDPFIGNGLTDPVGDSAEFTIQEIE